MGQVEPIDMMIDFETLGVSRDAVLLSCGILLFDEDRVVKEHYSEYYIPSQIGDGRTVDKSTVDWWIHTDVVEFNRLLSNSGNIYPPYDLEEFMENAPKIRHVWSRGSLDFEILNYYLEEKIPYWKSKDTRTLDVFKKMSGKNNHNALDDCRNQVAHVREVTSLWNVPVVT